MTPSFSSQFADRTDPPCLELEADGLRYALFRDGVLMESGQARDEADLLARWVAFTRGWRV